MNPEEDLEKQVQALHAEVRWLRILVYGSLVLVALSGLDAGGRFGGSTDILFALMLVVCGGFVIWLFH